jgi:hypothetical protein
MAYQHLNRLQRKAMAAFSRSEAKRRPKVLTPIPRDRWPANRAMHPTECWESSTFLVQLFDAPVFQGIDTRQLSISRVTLKEDGHWDENVSWDELMECKRQAGFGDWYAVEIYPRDRDIVNCANLRHLWMLAAPLDLGWFDGTPAHAV